MSDQKEGIPMEKARELDAEVAEKVMGGKTGRFITGDEGEVYEGLPRYSTDMADAWKVVEALSGFVGEREQPWWSVAVFYCQKRQVGCRVYACHPGQSFFETSVRHVIAETVDDTAPLAICRAALEAVGQYPRGESVVRGSP